MGFYGIYPLVITNIAMENHHLLSSFPFKTVIIQSYVKLLEGKLDSLMLFLYHMLFRVSYNDLTSTSLGMMVNKGNHPQMASIQVRCIAFLSGPF